VEPQPQLYARLAWAMTLQRTGLLQRKLIAPGDATAQRLDRLIALLDGLAAIAGTELRNETLTADAQAVIAGFGDTLTGLLPVPAAPAVAESFSAYPDTLVCAVGRPAALWVIVSCRGQLQAARGAVYTAYEFTRPADAPLTPADWQALRQSTPAPALPAWCRSYLIEPAPPAPAPNKPAVSAKSAPPAPAAGRTSAARPELRTQGGATDEAGCGIVSDAVRGGRPGGAARRDLHSTQRELRGLDRPGARALRDGGGRRDVAGDR